MNADERQLRSALEHFNSVTDNLIQAYQLLEAQVAELNVKLQVANDELVAKSVANEQLAAKLSTLLQVMPAGVLELDEEGRVVALNAAVQSYLPGLLPGALWQLEEHFHSGEQEGVYVSKQGGQHFTVLACPLPGTGAFLLMVDVSKLHHLHQQLAQQERLAVMGRMAASLAHQIRTPLATALLYAANLQRDDLPADGRSRFAGKVVNRLQALESLVQDMLRFVRIGPTDGGNEPFALMPVLAELEAVIGPQLQAKQLQWQPQIDGDAIVAGRRSDLLGALVNLLENACEHAPVGSRLTLQARFEAEFYVIRVIDQGKGVPEQVESQIFDPFFTTRANGTGLGLAIVKRVVEDMKGQIHYLRDSRGTVFELLLPVQATV
ncbi:MAG: sensor histidine kinase [Vogesella sp.]|uniref:sensor histidine kinase n=1 Tax=Vogesella sp. TaxID=1904252 RepID=UPI00391D406A